MHTVLYADKYLHHIERETVNHMMHTHRINRIYITSHIVASLLEVTIMTALKRDAD